VRRALVAALLALLALPPAALAAFAPGASLVSVSYARLEQGDDSSTAVALSSDGRYAAFDTRARNFFADDDPDPPGAYRAGGIFRRDMQTNALELVADGDVRDEISDDLLSVGAHQPSISGDGRYVSFSTAQKLVPADTNGNVDVYVRDMNVPVRAPGAFALVSAPNGTSAQATYADPPTPRPGRNPGADTWAGSSISGDGRKVAFRTVQVNSNLPAGGPTTDTPAGQVLVRDLDSRTTTLITRKTSDGSPAGGATGPLAISADGTTVAWPGRFAAAQTPFLTGEVNSDAFSFYLWQRIGQPTRRITGATDLDDPGCPAGSSITPSQGAQGPCYGPLTDPEGARGDVSSYAPALSADGYSVAFLVTAGPRGNPNTAAAPDVWVTDMHPGVSRKAGSRELTRDGSPSDPRSTGSIDDVAISSDGGRIALVTSRSRFILPFPASIGTFRSDAAARDVDLIDLNAGTIERVTRGSDGSDTNADLLNALSVSSDATKIAFASNASNMITGDANAKSDVFVAQVAPEPPPEAPPVEEPPPPPEDITPITPRLGVKQKRLADGSVEMTVTVPAAGVLEASTKGRLAASRKEARKSRRKLPLRVVASGKKTARTSGSLSLKLKLSSRYREELRRLHTIRTSARLEFRPASGGTRLHRSVSVVFALKRK
jgi:hypothetical protein